MAMELNERQKKEYQTVMLAGLLHDVGKFFGTDYGCEPNSDNLKQAECFLDGNPEIGWPGFSKWLKAEDREWFSFILSHHHEGLVEKVINSNLSSEKRILAAIIGEAIHLSIGKANMEKRCQPGPIRALFPDIVNCGNAVAKEYKDKEYYYLYNKLNADSVLPVEKDKIAGSDEMYRNHIKDFICEFTHAMKLFPEPSFETIYYLLKKYLWCIPATHDAESGVSLFNHLKTTAAITAALYQYYANRFTDFSDEMLADISDKSKVRYSLIQGDISGIQKFIYNISSKGASRGLKGRSFYLQLLSEAVNRYILHQCELSVANLIYSSGGKFYILSYNIEETAVRDFENQVNMFLYKEFGGIIYFAVGKTDFNGDALTGDFSQIWGNVNRNIADSKRNKFKHLMETDYSHVFEPGNAWGNIEFCSICGKEDTNLTIDEEKRKCPACIRAENIGANLKRFNYLGEITDGEDLKDNADITFDFGNFHVGYNLYADLKSVAKRGTLYKINNSDFLSEGLCGFKFYGGNEAPKMAGDEIKTFDELGEEAKGIKRLGILRMDVDNLGFIFQAGLPREKKTLSHVTGLSFYFDMFFQGYINDILKDVKDSIYIVYSGGDDLFIIGSWNVVVEQAIKIRNAFSRFTAFNPHITMSAGIGLIPYKYPVSRGAIIAGDAESKAKSFREEKDGITFLDKTLSWKNFELCQEIKVLIMGIAREKKGIINRLKQIYLLYKKNEALISHGVILTDEVKEKIFYNQWMWRMVYSLYRFAKNNDEKKVEIEALKHYLVKNVYHTCEAEGDAIGFIDIPARWAEFELRNVNKEEMDDDKR
ncbi:MAG: type III-A CRISPR-associated protein Cas10/Csm1 [Candidatus Omnitrophota bacterium]